MRPLILFAVMLSLPAAARAVETPPTAQADWRRGGVDDRVKAALTGLGWRLEDDGRALDPKTKAPVSKAVLDKAVLDLRQDARRAALEQVNLLLASGKPLSPADKEKIAQMSQDLPRGLIDAVFDPKSDLNRIKAMAEADLAGVAAYFEGGRSLADRQAAAQPVVAAAAGPRVGLPYYTVTERSVGEKLQAAVSAEIGRDPFGKKVLSRLSGKNGLDLPAIIIEDRNGPVAANYDFRRKALVLDREGVLASVVGTVPPRQASALRLSLSTRSALLAYLDAHPEAVTAVLKENDVVIVHELTHAWQDRRDPLFREIARGNIPNTQPLEYEEEAYKTKNLYLHSKLKNDPASVKMDPELDDYIEMMRSRSTWRNTLKKTLRDASPSRAMTLNSIEMIEAGRLERTKGRGVVTSDDQRAKALDLAALGQGRRMLAEVKEAHKTRMAEVNAAIDTGSADRYKVLGAYYLVQAQFAPRSADRIALLGMAEDNANKSGNAALIDEVRKAKEGTQ